jgi:hypothetical protein
MGSCNLNELEWVFESVCAAVRVLGSLPEDSKAFLRRRLFMLACNGMTDPDVCASISSRVSPGKIT